MAVTIKLLNRDVTESNPVPGRSCKEHIIEEGLMQDGAPEDTWQVTDADGTNIDNEPIENYDNQKVVIAPVVVKGG